MAITHVIDKDTFLLDCAMVIQNSDIIHDGWMWAPTRGCSVEPVQYLTKTVDFSCRIASTGVNVSSPAHCDTVPSPTKQRGSVNMISYDTTQPDESIEHVKYTNGGNQGRDLAWLTLNEDCVDCDEDVYDIPTSSEVGDALSRSNDVVLKTSDIRSASSSENPDRSESAFGGSHLLNKRPFTNKNVIADDGGTPRWHRGVSSSHPAHSSFVSVPNVSAIRSPDHSTAACVPSPQPRGNASLSGPGVVHRSGNSEEIRGPPPSSSHSVPHVGGPVPIAAAYDVVYSESYSVPVMYVHAWNARTGCPLGMERMWNLLLDTSPYGGVVDRWNTVTPCEHPVHGAPVFRVHPCHTAEFMGAVRTECGRCETMKRRAVPECEVSKTSTVQGWDKSKSATVQECAASKNATVQECEMSKTATVQECEVSKSATVQEGETSKTAPVQEASKRHTRAGGEASKRRITCECETGRNYVLTWLSVVAPLVGLRMPLSYFTRLSSTK